MAILSLVKCNDIDSSVQNCSNSIANALEADSIQRCHLTRIGNPIVEIRRSNDRLISTNGFPTLVRWYLYIESGPWSYCSLVLNHPCDSFTRFSHMKHIFSFFYSAPNPPWAIYPMIQNKARRMCWAWQSITDGICFSYKPCRQIDMRMDTVVIYLENKNMFGILTSITFLYAPVR